MRTCERCSCHSDDFCANSQFYTPPDRQVEYSDSSLSLRRATNVVTWQSSGAKYACWLDSRAVARNDKWKIWNIPLACRARQHQADNLAKLWQEILSLLELIAKIFCAVVIVRTSEVLGNTQPRVAVASAPFEFSACATGAPTKQTILRQFTSFPFQEMFRLRST